MLAGQISFPGLDFTDDVKTISSVVDVCKLQRTRAYFMMHLRAFPY